MSVPPAGSSPRTAGWSEHPGGRTGGTVALVLGIVLGAVACIGVLIYLLSALGAVGVGIAAVAALVPFGLVIAGVAWIDRWEPEPRPVLLFALLWGAGVAVAVALLFDLGVEIASAALGTKPSDLVQAVVQAPIVEESAKGLAVLLILWFGRRNFDGPVDGVVYAVTVAAGFAFTENVLYFGGVIVSDGVGTNFAVTFVARGLFSPFAHALFTSCTGYALGRAAQRTGAVGAIPYFVAGLVPAIVLHALWNGGLSLAADVVRYYLLVEVPIFAGAVTVVVLIRRTERDVTAARLREFAMAGWFTDGEAAMLSSLAGRRGAMRWAAAQPGGKRAAMRRFIADSTRLAQARARAASTKTMVGGSPDEAALLQLVVADRAALLT